MSTDVSLPAAVAAGLISFLSPCVLPLVPPYLCYLAGTTLEELQGGDAARARRDAVLASLLFVAGFTTVFVALGATASALGTLVRQFSTSPVDRSRASPSSSWGCISSGCSGWACSTGEARVEVQRPAGTVERLCDGARLRVRLDALHRADPGRHPGRRGLGGDRGARGGPAAALFGGARVALRRGGPAIGPSSAFFRRFRAHFDTVEKVAGVLLVITGIAFLTGGMQSHVVLADRDLSGLARLWAEAAPKKRARADEAARA